MGRGFSGWLRRWRAAAAPSRATDAGERRENGDRTSGSLCLTTTSGQALSAENAYLNHAAAKREYDALIESAGVALKGVDADLQRFGVNWR